MVCANMGKFPMSRNCFGITFPARRPIPPAVIITDRFIMLKNKYKYGIYKFYNFPLVFLPLCKIMLHDNAKR